MKKILGMALVGAAAFALSSASVADAAVYVDFSIADLFVPGTVTGVLTFNGGIGDTTVDAVVLTSNNMGENSADFTLIYDNLFSWSGSDIVSSKLRAYGVDSYGRWFGITWNVNSWNELNCDDIDATMACINYSVAVDLPVFATRLTTVPLPAGFPLILTGVAAIGGISGLKRRKRRKAEV